MKTATAKSDKYATKRDLYDLEERFDSKLDRRFAQQTQEIVGVIHDVMDRFDERFVRLELRMDKLEKRMDNLEQEIAGIKKDLERLFDLADKIIKQQEISEQERLIMGYQLKRMDEWVHQLAKKLGVKLTA